MTKLFNDALGFKWDIPSQTLADLKDILLSDSQGKKRLLVDIDATHSGVLTNGRVYPYVNVKDAYKSFFDEKDGGTAKYPAPVLTHHDEYKDAIGRIKKAEFKTLKSGHELEYDYENPDPVGSKGSGVVTVQALISDEESIQKVLDGRYYTVSSGFSVKDMHCSICADSIFRCDHIPMKRYDEDGEPDSSGHLCFGITDQIQYKEVSFVNTPAQAVAQVNSFKWEDAKGSSAKDNKTLVSLHEVQDSLVNQAVLITDNLEFDLLTGKESRRKQVKYSIAPTAQEKLKNLLSSSKTESTDDHSDKSREAPTKIETKLDTNIQGEKMTVKDDTNLEKTVSSLTDTNENLTADLKTANADLQTATDKVSELEQAVTAKDARIESLESEAQELRAEVTDMLAATVASLRTRLEKPDTLELDSEEKKVEYRANLAKRSLESLKDSITDLTLEADRVKDSKDTEPDLSDTKVESNVLSNGSTPKKTVKATHSDALDALFD